MKKRISLLNGEADGRTITGTVYFERNESEAVLLAFADDAFGIIRSDGWPGGSTEIKDEKEFEFRWFSEGQLVKLIALEVISQEELQAHLDRQAKFKRDQKRRQRERDRKVYERLAKEFGGGQ